MVPTENKQFSTRPLSSTTESTLNASRPLSEYDNSEQETVPMTHEMYDRQLQILKNIELQQIVGKVKDA